MILPAVGGSPAAVRVRWADWLLATIDEMAGADRPMLPLHRSFPDSPRDVEAVYVRRLLTHLLAVPGAPCAPATCWPGWAPAEATDPRGAWGGYVGSRRSSREASQ